MRRSHFIFLLAIAALTSGCKDPRVDALTTRVTTLETENAALKTEHDKTRAKLQELLVWVNKQSPPKVGLVDWIDAVQAKVFGGGDGSKPGAPPPPF
jgi:hypothetical protein